MGGMFNLLKVRRWQAPDDYSDPGWYKQPAGTQAHEVSPPPEATRAPQTASPQGKAGDVDVNVRKPLDHAGH